MSWKGFEGKQAA